MTACQTPAPCGLLRDIDTAAEAGVSAARDGGTSVVRGRAAVDEAGTALAYS